MQTDVLYLLFSASCLFFLFFLNIRTIRKEFINAKYVDHKFARKMCSSAVMKLSDLYDAVRSRDLLALIQVYAEGVELTEPLPDGGQVSQWTMVKFVLFKQIFKQISDNFTTLQLFTILCNSFM